MEGRGHAIWTIGETEATAGIERRANGRRTAVISTRHIVVVVAAKLRLRLGGRHACDCRRYALVQLTQRRQIDIVIVFFIVRENEFSYFVSTNE